MCQCPICTAPPSPTAITSRRDRAISHRLDRLLIELEGGQASALRRRWLRLHKRALEAFWAGALALAFHNSAYIAEIIRSGFQSVPKGLTEASRSLGMSKAKTLKRVQAPLALRTVLPVLGNQYIIAVKDSSLVSFIGMTELFQTSRNMAATTYEPLTAYIVVAIYYLVIVLALTALVSWLEHRLSAHRRPESDTQVRQPEQEGVKP